MTHADELSFLQTIRADIEATTHPNYRHFSNRTFWLRVAAKVLISANVRVVVTYRVAHRVAKRPHLMPLAMWLRARGIRSSGAELNPLASIGPGLYLAHSVGVGVAANVQIGSNCTLHLGSVLGPLPSNSDAGAPPCTVIGDDVFIGTHAVIMGGVKVGNGAMIGANAVVMRDVEPYTVVSSSPGRTVGKRSEPS